MRSSYYVLYLQLRSCVRCSVVFRTQSSIEDEAFGSQGNNKILEIRHARFTKRTKSCRGKFYASSLIKF